MAQRVLRLLVIVAAVGVLLMHGADASAAATHESAPAVAHQHHDEGDTDAHTVHWHHVALACIAVLTAAVAVARRGRQSRIGSPSCPGRGLVASWRQPVSSLLGTGPPAWIDLAVIRR